MESSALTVVAKPEVNSFPFCTAGLHPPGRSGQHTRRAEDLDSIRASVVSEAARTFSISAGLLSFNSDAAQWRPERISDRARHRGLPRAATGTARRLPATARDSRARRGRLGRVEGLC